MKPSIFVNYCDDVIQHVDPGKHSAVGIYPGVYPIKEFPWVVPKIGFSIALSIPATYDRLYNDELNVEIMKEDKVIASVTMPPVNAKLLNDSGVKIEEKVFNGFALQTIECLYIEEETELKVRLRIGDDIVAESETLKFIFSPV
ncbi:hypothetical protein [Eikenella corrodens]|uniref:hypothetical protein n=1 Tax=Eikenella corrodens TaxID=539 RepID=UPI0028E21F4D|nr:hypothetical protein [Eikenella corrodens]